MRRADEPCGASPLVNVRRPESGVRRRIFGVIRCPPVVWTDTRIAATVTLCYYLLPPHIWSSSRIRVVYYAADLSPPSTRSVR